MNLHACSSSAKIHCRQYHQGPLVLIQFWKWIHGVAQLVPVRSVTLLSHLQPIRTICGVDMYRQFLHHGPRSFLLRDAILPPFFLKIQPQTLPEGPLRVRSPQIHHGFLSRHTLIG